MKRRLLLGFTVLALAFCALPALAASTDPAGDALLAAIFAPSSAPDLGVAPAAPGCGQAPADRPQVVLCRQLLEWLHGSLLGQHLHGDQLLLPWDGRVVHR